MWRLFLASGLWAAAPVAPLVLAQGSEPAAPSLAPLAQYGVVGVIASLGIWFSWQAYKRERDRGDRLEKRLEDYMETTAKESTPAVLQAAELMRTVLPFLEQAKDFPALMGELRVILQQRRQGRS